MLLGLYVKAQTALVSLRSHIEGFGSRFRNEDGIVAVEYLVLMVLVALAIIVGATALGVAINARLNDTAGQVTNGF